MKTKKYHDVINFAKLCIDLFNDDRGVYKLDYDFYEEEIAKI